MIFSDEYYMKKALDEARKAFEAGEIPVGCIVECERQIVARTHNLTQTLNDVTAHAEMQAITAAANMLGGKYLNNCTLYVTLEPCLMCAGALAWSQVHKIVYGASDPKQGYTLYNPNVLHPKTAVVSGVLSDESTELLKMFFAARRS